MNNSFVCIPVEKNLTIINTAKNAGLKISNIHSDSDEITISGVKNIDAGEQITITLTMVAEVLGETRINLLIELDKNKKILYSIKAFVNKKPKQKKPPKNPK